MRHSSFWLDDVVYEALDPTSPEYIIQLSDIRRAIANFVYIATGRDIPVKFSSGAQSYAYGEGADQGSRAYVVISATTDPTKFDVQVGTALHEAAHIILSQKTDNTSSIPVFRLLKSMVEDTAAFCTPLIWEHNERLQYHPLGSLFKIILNVLEDRRDDKWMYIHNPGYRGYYEAMYQEVWHSEDITARFASPAVNEPTIEAYLFHLINMTNRAADPHALPGLMEIWDIVHLPSIERFAQDVRWDTWEEGFLNGVYEFDKLPEMAQAVIRIAEVILKHAQIPKARDGEDGGKPNRGTPDPDNLDMPDVPPPEDLAAARDELADLLNELTDILDGDIDFENIAPDITDFLDSLESAGAQLTTVGKAPVVVYHKFTQAMTHDKQFHFCSGRREEHSWTSIAEGERMGIVLADQLQVLAEETPLTYTRLSHGRIDKRRLAGLGYDQEDVFAQCFIERHDPVLVHLTIDSSSSMAGEKWLQSLKLAAALAKAAEQVPSIDVVISFRASSTRDAFVCVLMAYDSRVDAFSKIKTLFPYLRPYGGTPEGLAFEAIKSLILDGHTSTRRFFVNISDGQPDYVGRYGSFSYSGETAWEHTRQQIQDLRANGIQILSYYVAAVTSRLFSLPDGFKRMYGPDATMIDAGSVGAIAQTLNRLFLA